MNEKALIKKEKDEYKNKMIELTNSLEIIYDRYIIDNQFYSKYEWYDKLFRNLKEV